MGILIGIFEAIFILVVVVGLTFVASHIYWKNKTISLVKQIEREHKTKTYDLLSELKHQATHCLRPIKDNLYFIKSQMPQFAAETELHQSLVHSLADIEHYEWRLTRLIENMAMVSRLDVPDRMRRVSEVKLDAIVGDVVSEFQDVAETKGVELTWWARPDTFPRIMANPEELRQLFINLIDNAIKYCDYKDEIDVSLEANAEKKIIYAQVSDTGVGIPEEDHLLIFQQGYTVEEVRNQKPKEGSQGLGLYISKRIVGKHGGKIDVASEQSNGTLFTITLPM